MTAYLFPLGQLSDDSDAILSAPSVTISGILDRNGSVIAGASATIYGGGNLTPVAVAYDADAYGEAWIRFTVSQSGRTVTEARKSPLLFASLDPSRIATAAGTGAGTGARAVTVSVVFSDVIADARVRFTSGLETYVQSTDGTGTASFALNDGTYTLSVAKSGYTFVPRVVTISADTAISATLSVFDETPIFDLNPSILAPKKVHTVKVGDDGLRFRDVILNSAGERADITGCTVQLRLTARASGSVLWTKTGTVEFAPLGVVNYTFAAADLVAGVYNRYWIVTDADANVYVYPADGSLGLIVKA